MKIKLMFVPEVSSPNFDAGFHVTLLYFSTIYTVNVCIFFTSGPLAVSVSCTKPGSCFELYGSVFKKHETPVS